MALPTPADTATDLARTAEVGVAGVSSFFTDNREFYRVDTALIVPAVAADHGACGCTAGSNARWSSTTPRS